MSKEELLKYLISEIDLIMHDKDYRFENANGTWYSRESCRDLTNEEVLEELRTELRQLADLEAKLAEKDKEIEYQENMKILAVDNQNKKAIEQLEKVKDWCKEYRTEDEFGVSTINVDDELNTEDNLLNFIDNQIKQLKEK